MKTLSQDLNTEFERLYKYDKLIDALLKRDLDACESEANNLSR